MKKLLLLLMIVLMSIGAVHAADFDVVSISSTASSPPVLNQNTVIVVDVILRNSSSSMSTTLELNSGSGTQSKTITLTPNLVTPYYFNVNYATTGVKTLTATVDPANALTEDFESNNAKSLSLTVQGTTTTATVSSVSLTANSGSLASGTVTLSNTGNVDLSNVVLSSSNLVSGTNTIQASAVTINPATLPMLYSGASVPLTATVNVPTGQASGTYTGTINAVSAGVTYSGTITVVVNNIVSGPSFTVSDVEFGSTTTERGIAVTQTLRLTNNGNQALTLSLTSNLPSTYTVTFSQSVVSLNPGASTDVTVTINVPKTQNSGRVELSGGIVVSATNVPGLTRTAKTYLTTENMLEITKVTIELNDDGNEENVDDDEDYEDDLKPEVPITIHVYVKNQFSSSDNMEIQDIEVDIRSSGDLDLDESDEISDLEDGDKDSVSFSAEIPDDAEDGDDYDIDITVDGRDENGARHSDDYSFTLTIDEESHEISIKSASLTPETVKCGDTVIVNVNMENTGRADEDDVVLQIYSDDLDINKAFQDLTIDEDDTLRKSYSFDISKNVRLGQYDVYVNTYYDGDEESDTEVLTLDVQSCTTTTTTNNQANNGNTNTGTSTNTNTNTNVPVITPPAGTNAVYGKTSFTESPAYLILLGAAVVVMLLILIILVTKFVF